MQAGEDAGLADVAAYGGQVRVHATGVRGLLRPHIVEIGRAHERRRAGVPDLTSRQLQLLRLVADGHSNTQIAHRLFVAEGTVRKHLENIYERLGVTSRTAAVATAFAVTHSA